jgi:hypothetical protein
MRRMIAAGALVAVAFAVTARPADAVTFTATLNAIKISAQPGQVITRPFELTLHPDQPRTVFTARAEDWWRSEDNTQSFYAPPGRLRRSCGSWVSVNPMEAAVDPGGTLKVRITVAVPTEVENGGYWCALTVDETPDPAAANAGVAVRFLASVSVGIFVYIDPVERAAEIGDVAVSHDQAAITLHNHGNAPLTVEGRVEFARAGSEEATPVATATLPRATVLTEPARTSVLRTSLPGVEHLPSGRYVVRAILDIGLDHYIGLEREIDIRRVPGDEGSR